MAPHSPLITPKTGASDALSFVLVICVQFVRKKSAMRLKFCLYLTSNEMWTIRDRERATGGYFSFLRAKPVQSFNADIRFIHILKTPARHSSLEKRT